MSKEGKYRRGVGVMLLNSEGKVFVGARIDNTDEAWQMPQGGVDTDDDDEWATAVRELEEETGIPPHLVERVSATPERLTTCPKSFAASCGAGNGSARTRTGFSLVSSAATATSTSPRSTPSSANGSGSSLSSFPS